MARALKHMNVPTMGEDLLDHRPILDVRDDPQRPPAAGAALDVDPENAP